ncbi:type VI secretion system Vgr family protein [Thiosocius teredinicola]|uniref:type VI secretion system Vgr family protein n=1 Tax=Thiosocius teredinicola TaxID=1973002 RepID=UPI000990B6EC
MDLLFSAETRLYELEWPSGAPGSLLVEAWWGREALSAGFEIVIDGLSTDAFLELKAFMGQPVTLVTTLADGTLSRRSALVRAADKLGADGGFTRYRLTLVPWTWLLGRGRHNRVFQDKSVVEIIDLVFGDYAAHAAWQWSDEVGEFLADTRPRSFCVQYRESDYAFVSRLLAEEGLAWCVEEDEAAPAGHRIRLFADSVACPSDEQSDTQGAIRFHRVDSQETEDAITALGSRRQLDTTVMTVLSYDYKAKRAVTAQVPTHHSFGGEHAPVLEHYEPAGQYAHATRGEADRYLRLAMQAREARYKSFFGRGSVRTFRPGFAFDLSESPLDLLEEGEQAGQDTGDNRRFLLTELTHVGINNLSGESIDKVAKRLAGPLGGDDLPTGDTLAPLSAPTQLPAELLDLARQRGYGNRFETLRAKVPWRPRLRDDTGVRINPRPLAPGPMTAIVVGPHGEDRPNGVDEIWCDALGRIKVRFHWQRGERADDRLTCWLRVASRQAGNGMGWQWLPRIGQEVLVDFLEGDIDRPLVIGALYNGQGEGGVIPTPGGDNHKTADTSVFNEATDHSPSGQGNLAAGHSPAWHGAASTSHAHAAALSGFKTKAFGGEGYNQLVFDDTDDQQRVQLKTTQHHTELNLGHLVHQADNYRGSFRGAGAELRTDAYGALRGGQGVLMSTWARRTPAEPAGDLTAGMALLNQAKTLASTLSKAAKTHQTVELANSVGSSQANGSFVDPKLAPIPAMHQTASGMVEHSALNPAESDANNKNTQVSSDKVPHFTDPAIIQAAKAGLANVAGQHLQFANGETFTAMSGQDTDIAVGGKARVHTGQAIGLLAGAIQPGEGNTGITLIAAKDPVDMQAQSDQLKLQAKQDLKLVSARADIDFAAAKKVHLAVAGGASITIDGGITVECPGTITVHASKKSFSGPVQGGYSLPNFPRSDFRIKKRFSFSS